MSPAVKHSVRHLRLLVLSLGVILVALLGVLFGLRMEAVAYASGTIQVRDLFELRAGVSGLAELGWYEGEVFCSGQLLGVRLDRHGFGMSDPNQGECRKIENFRCREVASQLTLDQLSFHKLESGDRLWPGQVVGQVRGEDWLPQTQRLLVPASGPTPAPPGGVAWSVLKVFVRQGQAVKAGEVLACFAPIDPSTHEPRAWIARIDIPEKHAAEVVPGQEVRLFSAMYNQRLHGHVRGTIEKIEPAADASPSGERHFQAQVRIVSAPFTLYHGSGVKAEILLGHKHVYRIILEQ